MHAFLVDLLIRPACHGELQWKMDAAAGVSIEAATAVCRACGSAYAVRDGIGCFLISDATGEDLWAQTESGLERFLHENPEAERRLRDSSLDRLNPADQFFRALLLESRGEFREADAVEAQARRGLYAPEYRAAWQAELDALVERLPSPSPPIVDLASGRGELVDALLARGHAPIVVSDLSLPVLRRDRARLSVLGLLDRVSLLAFDIRRSPFREASIDLLTTNLGLANLRDAGPVAAEVHRILRGRFLAITHFYPEHDANASAIDDTGLGEFLYRPRCEAVLAAAGLELAFHGPLRAPARPTPVAEIVPGARIDRLPQTETTLEWCVLEARRRSGRAA